MPRLPLRSCALRSESSASSLVFGIFVLNRLWPSSWAWAPEQPAYLHMILGIYVTLGVFLFLAARDPMRHLSLIWFTVWSSIVHAVVIAVHEVS